MFGWLKKGFKSLLDKISLASTGGNNSQSLNEKQVNYKSKVSTAFAKGQFQTHEPSKGELSMEKGLEAKSAKAPGETVVLAAKVKTKQMQI